MNGGLFMDFMLMVDVTFVCLALVVLMCVGAAGYSLGKRRNNTDLKASNQRVQTLYAVQHNLNCMVGDLRYEVKELKPDALAFRTLDGLWCIDNVNVIKHHARKELFFRIGYPEHKL